MLLIIYPSVYLHICLSVYPPVHLHYQSDFCSIPNGCCRTASLLVKFHLWLTAFLKLWSFAGRPETKWEGRWSRLAYSFGTVPPHRNVIKTLSSLFPKLAKGMAGASLGESNYEAGGCQWSALGWEEGKRGIRMIWVEYSLMLFGIKGYAAGIKGILKICPKN